MLYLRRPLEEFEFGNSVADVTWSPYSSTVFAAITIDGKLFIYDLNVDSYHAICTISIAKKQKFTRIAFSLSFPIIIAGDSR